MTAALVVSRQKDAEHFLAAAQDWLLDAEAENNLLLGIAHNHRGREPTSPPPYWATVLDAGAIAGCVCRTPPNKLALSRLPLSALAPLADDVGAAYEALNGVIGPTAEATRFAEVWTARHGRRWQVQIRLRLHELTRASFTARLRSGSLRAATQTDLALAREWTDAYIRDTGLQDASPEIAVRLIERGQLFLWIDEGAPRAMVAATRGTRSGCSINSVYTPPEHRRHGYATAAVSALSDVLLRDGRRFCCLYTDAANPTSNSVYAKIGFRPIRDDVEIAFVP